MSAKKKALRLSFISIVALFLVLGVPAAMGIHGLQSDSFAPATVYAAGGNQIGANGSDVTWELVDAPDTEGAKILKIHGTGAINSNYFSNSTSPWWSSKDVIVEVFMEDGITSIPSYAFCRMGKLKNIHLSKGIEDLPSKFIYICNCEDFTAMHLPEGLKTIQKNAIDTCQYLEKIYLPSTLESIDNKAFYQVGYSYLNTSPFSGTYYGYPDNEATTEFIAQLDPDYGKFCDIRCEAGHTLEVSRDESGTYHNVCSVCGKVATLSDNPIYDIVVSNTTYKGSPAKTDVKIYYNNKYNQLSSSYYDVGYENNDQAGTACAVVTFKNGYSGTVRIPFTVEPPAPYALKCTPITGGFRVHWEAYANNADKFVVTYSNRSDGAKTKTVDGSARSVDIFGKYMYQYCTVKVTAYKTIDGVSYSTPSKEIQSCLGGKEVAKAANVKVPSKKTVTVGFKTQLALDYDTIYYKLDKSKVKWQSSNKKIATVNKNGLVKAKKKGKCYIYCTYDGKKMKTRITVAANEFIDNESRLSELDPYSSYHRYVELYEYKINYNKKGQLVMKVALVNRRMFKAEKFNWITITVYDKNQKIIAKQKFKNVKINCKAYGKKYMTFTFNKGTKKKKFDLRDQYGFIGDDYYYTYSY